MRSNTPLPLGACQGLLFTTTYDEFEWKQFRDTTSCSLFGINRRTLAVLFDFYLLHSHCRQTCESHYTHKSSFITHKSQKKCFPLQVGALSARLMFVTHSTNKVATEPRVAMTETSRQVCWRSWSQGPTGLEEPHSNKQARKVCTSSVTEFLNAVCYFAYRGGLCVHYTVSLLLPIILQISNCTVTNYLSCV